MSKKNHNTRIDPMFREWMKEIAIERVKRDLEKEIISPREVSRMLMNTEARLKAEEELLSKGRKSE